MLPLKSKIVRETTAALAKEALNFAFIIGSIRNSPT